MKLVFSAAKDFFILKKILYNKNKSGLNTIAT